MIDEDGDETIERRLRFKPRKTAGESEPAIVDIIVAPELDEVIDVLPKTQMIFLQSSKGRAYSDKSLSNMIRAWTAQAGIPHCSAHGVRKAYSTLLAEDGATDRQLMAMFGWKSEKTASIYTRARAPPPHRSRRQDLQAPPQDGVIRERICPTLPEREKSGIETGKKTSEIKCPFWRW